MANIDADLRTHSGRRPRATVETYRFSEVEERQASIRHAPCPKFSRITAGQLLRTAILVILCLGAFELIHAEKTGESRGAAFAGERV